MVGKHSVGVLLINIITWKCELSLYNQFLMLIGNLSYALCNGFKLFK